MNGGQITYFILLAIGLIISAYQHGKPKTGNHDFFEQFFCYVISFAILFWGGFFK